MFVRTACRLKKPRQYLGMTMPFDSTIRTIQTTETGSLCVASVSSFESWSPALLSRKRLRDEHHFGKESHSTGISTLPEVIR